MMTPDPPRQRLALLPTPLEPLVRISDALGVEIFVKRDDCTGVGLSGNKIRKLEFLLADAIAQGCDTVITGGGEQSNHCRATAIAAARLGLRSTLCLRTLDKSSPPPSRGNILLDEMVGAEICWIDHEDWKVQEQIYQREAERLRAAGRKPYIIPEGGSNALGAWGYLRACHELNEQLEALGKDAASTTILYACGSGGTGAGLVLGGKELHFSDRKIEIVGVNVCDDAAYFQKKIARLCRDFEAEYRIGKTVEESEVRILDGYVGRGYGKSSPGQDEAMSQLAQSEGLLLGKAYTGKAWYAMVSELQKDPRRFGERIVFVHTGGLFDIFA